jgi:hypothetical protein
MYRIAALCSVSGAVTASGDKVPAMLYASRRFYGVEVLREREAGEELIYFRKQDEQLLRKLLDRAQKAYDNKEEQVAAENATVADFKELKSIVDDKLTAQELEKLIAWKYPCGPEGGPVCTPQP